MFLAGKTSRFLRNRKPINLLTSNLKVGKHSRVAELVDAAVMILLEGESP
jgi:hypothetical protein